MADVKDRVFDAFRQLVPYRRGALWWARNDLIKDRHPMFNQNDDKIGHPLLMISQHELCNRFEPVPMLVGTSGKKMCDYQKAKCVMVTGMTRKERDKKTYFGSIIQPGLYSFDDDFLSQSKKPYYDKHGEVIDKDYAEKWYNRQKMSPNKDKPMIDDNEMRALNNWCDAHSR